MSRRDKDTGVTRDNSVTVTSRLEGATSPSRLGRHKKRSNVTASLQAWYAIATPEQIEAYKSGVRPVTRKINDDELPPPLRDGALESF